MLNEDPNEYYNKPYKEVTYSSSGTRSSFAILRIGNKMHSIAQVRGFEKHMERKCEVLNADPERSKYNRIIKGSPDIVGDLVKKLEGVKLRKNSVLCCDMLLTASHKYFEGIQDIEKEGWIQRNVKWLYDTYGEDRILYIGSHNDER